MFFILWLVLLSCVDAGVFDVLNNQTVSNADACNDLKSKEKCDQAGPCVWSDNVCNQDPCFARTATISSNCPTVTVGTCVRVPKVGADPLAMSHFCVHQDRVSSFTTKDLVCSLEWGGWKFVELAACKTLSTDAYGCGPVKELEGEDDSHYVCIVGSPPDDPCSKIVDNENLCTYVGECLYTSGADGASGLCVTDPCWEKTLTSTDQCKTNIGGVTCTKHILNGNGTPQIGYCKTDGHDLHSPCNVGTATNVLSKQVVCTWAATGIPADCNKVATINNYDDGTLYVCNPTGEEFDVNTASSLKSFATALSAVILLVVVLDRKSVV